MTIQELKDKKQALEQEIANKLMEFERETELKITNINLYAIAYCYSSCCEEESIGVKIEIKL